MKLWKILGIELYEVGDIIITSSSNNPSSRFKGTWELIAQGMAIVGVKPSDSDFSTVNKTGGYKTHIHGSDDMRAVITVLDNGNFAIKKRTGSSITITGYRSFGALKPGGGGTIEGASIEGNTNPQTSLQPYITKYIWERVS